MPTVQNRPCPQPLTYPYSRKNPPLPRDLVVPGPHSSSNFQAPSTNKNPKLLVAFVISHLPPLHRVLHTITSTRGGQFSQRPVPRVRMYEYEETSVSAESMEIRLGLGCDCGGVGGWTLLLLLGLDWSMESFDDSWHWHWVWHRRWRCLLMLGKGEVLR